MFSNGSTTYKPRMSIAALVFPHQLFRDQPVLRAEPDTVLLLEDPLFFGDARYPARFHKQKLAYHRATMASYARCLQELGVHHRIARYRSGQDLLPDLCRVLAEEGHTQLVVSDVHDFTLQRRLRAAAADVLELTEMPTPGFINSAAQNAEYRSGRKRWFMADFYEWQRRRLDVLMEADSPVGGKFSFDEDNRRKLPKKERALLPALPVVETTADMETAIASVHKDFPDNPGCLDEWYYPIDHAAADRWLEKFLEERFCKFGPYEDAIVQGESWLYHSILTPLLNHGLLTPGEVIDKALNYARSHDIPLNSVEGFVRQIIGWREFMRATYEDLGVAMRTTNHWGHTRRMPACFYDGSTGIDPIDDVIGRLLKTGYCHHIERLMVLGGFMFLCEIDPDDIYTWFMELFIDSADWVMVPNVYAMSQHADGGAITTKPYFSGSNYILKMSDHPKGEWCEVWDALFWRWIINHADELAGNRRWSMMVANARRMPDDKKAAHLTRANAFLEQLDKR